MTTSKNLWSDEIGQATLKVPKTILSEQATYFNEMTKNKLVAKINSKHSLYSGENVIVHDFDIVSPSLGNYTFTLFSVRHKIQMYPMSINFSLSEEDVFTVNNEEEFEDILSKIMTHKSTVNAINGLLAQA